MKKSIFITALIVFVTSVTLMIIVANSENTPSEEDINFNMLEPSLGVPLGDITIRTPLYSIGEKIGGLYMDADLIKDEFIFGEGQEVGEDGKLKNDKVFVEINSYICNKAKETTTLDLNEFYLVISDGGGNIKNISARLGYTYITDASEGVTLEDFKLTLAPNATTNLQVLFVEDYANVHIPKSAMKSNCYYRVKSNDDIGYYNIYSSLS